MFGLQQSPRNLADDPIPPFAQELQHIAFPQHLELLPDFGFDVMVLRVASGQLVRKLGIKVLERKLLISGGCIQSANT